MAGNSQRQVKNRRSRSFMDCYCSQSFVCARKRRVGVRVTASVRECCPLSYLLFCSWLVRSDSGLSFP